MKEEWEDDRYTCDSCGYDGKGKFYPINIRGWKPITICKECLEMLEVENE